MFEMLPHGIHCGNTSMLILNQNSVCNVTTVHLNDNNKQMLYIFSINKLCVTYLLGWVNFC